MSLSKFGLQALDILCAEMLASIEILLIEIDKELIKLGMNI